MFLRKTSSESELRETDQAALLHHLREQQEELHLNQMIRQLLLNPGSRRRKILPPMIKKVVKGVEDTFKQIGLQHLNGLHITERKRKHFVQSAHLIVNLGKGT